MGVEVQQLDFLLDWPIFFVFFKQLMRQLSEELMGVNDHQILEIKGIEMMLIAAAVVVRQKFGEPRLEAMLMARYWMRCFYPVANQGNRPHRHRLKSTGNRASVAQVSRRQTIVRWGMERAVHSVRIRPIDRPLYPPRTL